MLRLFFFVLILSSLHSCQAQTAKLILDKVLFDDFSALPLFPKLTTTENGVSVWKPDFEYIDDLNFYEITYLSDGLKVKGVLVEPKEDESYPCIIYNRGGNREFGAITMDRAAFLLGKVAKEGYVVIASQYRGNAGSEGQEEFGGAEVNDVLILTDVLKEVKKADADNIGMYGWSRGGMMTYRALTMTDKIKAAAVGGAVSDNFETIQDRPGMETNVLAELIPNYTEKKEEELTKRSAVFWADKFSKDVPILILHGNADWRVKPTQSLKMAMEFDKHRIPYRLILFEGADHGIREHRAEVDRQVIDWFDRFLKKGEAVPNMAYHGN